MNVARLTDPELVVAAIGGNGDAFGVLFDRHNGPITNWLARRVGLDRACDLCSDVFVWAIDNLDRYDPNRGSVGAWLHTRTRATLSRHLRRRRTWTVVSRKLPSTDTTDFDYPCEDGPASDALRGLPHPLRVSVWLRVCGGLSYEEIAERLDIAEPAARKRVSRGLALMKDTLENCPDAPTSPDPRPSDGPETNHTSCGPFEGNGTTDPSTYP